MSAENTTAVAVKKDISTQVLAKIETFQKSGELTLPRDYRVNVQKCLCSS